MAEKEDANHVDKWLADQRNQGKSQHTLSAYARALVHFNLWYAGVYGEPLNSSTVMPRDVRDWKAFQQTVEKASPATINQRLVAVNRFFRWASANGLTSDNPADGVSSISLPSRKPKSISTNNVRRLLRAARSNKRDYAIFEMLLGTGLRVGELLALQIGDVEVGERSGKVIVRKGKNSGYREVPLTSDVRAALRSYLETEHPSPSDPESPIWFGSDGALKHRSSITRMLEKYALQAGIDTVHPHALRHTFATRYLEANPDDLRGLARLLGHANLNTVMIYTEPTMSDLTQRMERVEAHLP